MSDSEKESGPVGTVVAVTHDGHHHMDDAMAAAILLEVYGDRLDIVRTKDPEALAAADIVFDVGGVYDEERLRFDHHQGDVVGMPECANRPRGFASCGLVWRRFGTAMVTGMIGLSEEAWVIDEVAEAVDKALMVPVDNWDCGLGRFSSGLPAQALISAMRFPEAVAACRTLLRATVKRMVRKTQFKADMLERLHTEGGPRVWEFGSHLVLEGAPGERVDLPVAGEVIASRYGRGLLGAVSPISEDKWVLVFTRVVITEDGKRAVAAAPCGEHVEIHVSGSMAFSREARPLLDAARVVSTGAGFLRAER